MTTVVLREAALEWQAPKRADGTSMALSGYKVHYGTTSKSYSSVVSVSASILQRTLALTPGKWYFAVSAIDANGVQCAKSNEVSKLIP